MKLSFVSNSSRKDKVSDYVFQHIYFTLCISSFPCPVFPWAVAPDLAYVPTCRNRAILGWSVATAIQFCGLHRHSGGVLQRQVPQWADVRETVRETWTDKTTHTRCRLGQYYHWIGRILLWSKLLLVLKSYWKAESPRSFNLSFF